MAGFLRLSLAFRLWLPLQDNEWKFNKTFLSSTSPSCFVTVFFLLLFFVVVVVVFLFVFLYIKKLKKLPGAN